jgi:hypothetical protein
MPMMQRHQLTSTAAVLDYLFISPRSEVLEDDIHGDLDSARKRFPWKRWSILAVCLPQILLRYPTAESFAGLPRCSSIVFIVDIFLVQLFPCIIAASGRQCNRAIFVA